MNKIHKTRCHIFTVRIINRQQRTKSQYSFILCKGVLRNIYNTNEVIIQIFHSQRKIKSQNAEAGQVAGSATCKHSETV